MRRSSVRQRWVSGLLSLTPRPKGKLKLDGTRPSCPGSTKAPPAMKPPRCIARSSQGQPMLIFAEHL